MLIVCGHTITDVGVLSCLGMVFIGTLWLLVLLSFCSLFGWCVLVGVILGCQYFDSVYVLID